MASLFCDNCGARLEAGDRFCQGCGLVVTGVDQGAGPTSAGLGATPSDSLRVGGRFRLEGVLGRGAGGTVYLAHDESLGGAVALKSLDPALAALPEFLARFRVEAATLATLSHPNVVGVRDYLEVDAGHYLVMERVQGPSLRQLLVAYGRLAPEQACGVLSGALLGLGYVHERGLLHGDIKPENVLVDREGVSQLSDFGQAVPLGSSASGGSAAYMSPEAISASALSERSDLYSMGVVLYECLAGQPPFASDQVATVLYGALNDAPPPIAGLASPMGDLLGRCLAKDPGLRPQSAHEFLAELTEAARRSYGADWLQRAGVAALAGAIGVGVAVASTNAGAAVLTASGVGPSGATATSLVKGAKGAASHSSRWLPKTLLANKAASVAAAAVLVTGAVAGGVVALSHHAPSRVQLASSYVMEDENLTFNEGAPGALTHVTEKSTGNITGDLIVDSPLVGSGPFTGRVQGSSITITAATGIVLHGRVSPSGNMSGTYVSVYGKEVPGGQRGTWSASPQGGAESAALATPKATTTTSTPTTTTIAISPTTIAVAPILGSAAWGLAEGSYGGISGFGQVAPVAITLGGLASSPRVGGISWSNWGAPQAMGQGQSIDGIGQTGPVSSWPAEPDTVVAFDLGSCDGGPPAYQEVVWYFPQDGQTFDPSRATNACTGS